MQALAFERLRTYETWVLQRYHLLPTDERFLALRAWECKLLYWVDTFWHRMAERVKKGEPVRTIEDLTLEESFDEQLAKLDEQLERERGPATPVPAPAPTDSVIRWTAPNRA